MEARILPAPKVCHRYFFILQKIFTTYGIEFENYQRNFCVVSHKTEFVNVDVETIFMHRKGMHQSSYFNFTTLFVLFQNIYPGLAAQVP